MAHEPSLGAFCIQEHVYKIAPVIANEIVCSEKMVNKLNGVIYDLSYTCDFVSSKLTESCSNINSAIDCVAKIEQKLKESR